MYNFLQSLTFTRLPSILLKKRNTLKGNIEGVFIYILLKILV